MEPLQGLAIPFSNIVCKLMKSLYGLKEASRQWYAELSDTLRDIRIQHSKTDYSLFCKQQGNSIVLLVVYADDITVTRNNPIEIIAWKAFLDDRFKIKDLGGLN